MLRCHTNSLNAELAAAEVEEVFQIRAQEVDDENVMETLLSKMVDLRNADCAASRGRSAYEHCGGYEERENSRVTYGYRSRFGMIDIHPEVEELQISGVPISRCKSAVVTLYASPDAGRGQSGMRWCWKRTNLIATGMLVRTLTPEREQTRADG